MESNSFNRRSMIKLALGAGVIGVPFATSGQVAQADSASATPMQGMISIHKLGPVTLHTYVAPNVSAVVTSQIIETANSLHIIDAQFVPAFAAEMRAYAESLGKPIEAVYLSHAHPDHVLGASQLSGLPFVTADEVMVDVNNTMDIYNGQKQQMGDTSPLYLPEGGLAAGTAQWDDVAVEIALVQNAEAPNALTFHVPEAGLLVAQDLLYANAHAFPLHNPDRWVTALNDMKATEGLRVIGAGHGLPAGPGAIEDAIRYIEFQNEVIAASANPEAATETLISAYPTYGAAGLLDFIGFRFQ